MLGILEAREKAESQGEDGEKQKVRGRGRVGDRMGREEERYGGLVVWWKMEGGGWMRIKKVCARSGNKCDGGRENPWRSVWVWAGTCGP